MKKTVVVSSCLLGYTCRYDGKTKKSREIVDFFSEYKVVPFCPEAPVFGTPRERISVVLKDNRKRIITDETNKDVTQKLASEIDSFIKNNPNIKLACLKSKSPSCGYGTTPILNEQKERVDTQNGLAVDMFLKNYKDIKILSELDCI